MPRSKSRSATVKRRYGPKKLRQIARAVFARGNKAYGKELMRAAKRKSKRKRSTHKGRR